MALAEDAVVNEYREDAFTRKFKYPVMNGEQLFLGAFCNINDHNAPASPGYIRRAGDRTTESPAGVVISEMIDNRLGEDGDHWVTIAYNGLWLVPSDSLAAEIDDVGRYVYATDDDTLEFAVQNVDPFGTIVGIDIETGRAIVQLLNFGQ